MKYSKSYMRSNLVSRKFVRFITTQTKAMVKETPELLDGEMDLSNTHGRELFVKYSNNIEIIKSMEDSKDFVIEKEIAEHFYKTPHVKQNFELSIQIPFKNIFITFEDPIPITSGIPKKMEQYMNKDYDEWLEALTGDSDTNLIDVEDRLHGIFILHDVEMNKAKRDLTLKLPDLEKVKSGDFNQYYEKTSPKSTFKVYFITDMMRSMIQILDKRTDMPVEELVKRINNSEVNELIVEADVPKRIAKLLDEGFEYTNIIFDSKLLPTFISEFEIRQIGLYDKPNNKIAKSLQKLMNLTINLINFINSNDTVEHYPIYHNKSTRKKYRKKYKGQKMPPLFYMLKLKYPKEVVIGVKKGESQSPYSYQFDVKGHFRHLKSKRYTKKRGQVIWVQPFKKGKGLYIPKNYEVDSPKEVVEDYEWDEKTG